MSKDKFTMLSSYVFGALAFLGGTGLMVSSGWLITMAASHPPVLTLTVSIVLVRFFGIGRSVARYFERVISHQAVFARLSSLRVALYNSLTQNSIAMARDFNSGTLVKKVVDDVERAEEYQLRIRLPQVSSWIALLAGVGLGFLIKPESVYVTLTASLILLLLLPIFIKKSCQQSAGRIENIESQYATELASLAYCVSEARIYGYLEKTLLQTHELEQKIKNEEIRLLKRSKHLQSAASATIAGSLIGLSLLSYLAKINGEIPNVQVTMLIFLPLVIFEAVTTWYPNLFVAGKLILAQKGVESIFKNPETPDLAYLNLAERIDRVELKHVSVAWMDTFMSPVNCSAKIGSPLVIRGRSGSGKSTLAMGLVGALGYKGSITINGYELRDIKNTHEIISASIQHSHIFNTSIRENLKIASPEATDAQLLKVIELVELTEMVEQADGGLDCIIGTYGRAISGGEAKRLSLARALLSDAPIVILDEPTEHLDAGLAERIEGRVLEEMKDRVLVVITHSGWAAIKNVFEITR